ncbi:MAG: macro domain-containing protein [Lachnospiraceae bacterium]|nr:macro domain-containing protein [Lachnospiraceae bacterium]
MRELRWEIRDMLDMSNVNERVVYPGLDGIATWISRHYYVRDTGRLHIEKEDIVNLNVEAIVNSADEDLKCSGNIAKRIFEQAGYDELTKECKAIGKCETGQIVVTKGYKLKAKYIIHAVTPRKKDYDEGGDEATELLRGVYRNALKWIKDNKIKYIGFPLLAGGFKRFGKTEAWRIGLEECKRFLKENEGSLRYYILRLG